MRSNHAFSIVCLFALRVAHYRHGEKSQINRHRKEANVIRHLGAAIVLLTCLGPASAAPSDFSFTGLFAADDDVQRFDFTAGGSSTVTLRSYGYSGGTQANGNVVASGGFDPILALFDGAGNLIQQHDDGPDPVPADPVTGSRFDTNLSLALAAGDYFVTIMQFNNFFIGLPADDISLGFGREGDPTFTSDYGCPNGQFCDLTAANRTNEWAFDILGVESASRHNVPEPGTAVLLGSALLLMGATRRRPGA